MSLARCQRETTSSQFVEWKVFLEMEEREKFSKTHKWEWYLAQIALEAFNSYKSKRKYKIKDFIIDFVTEKEEKKKKLPVHETQEEMEQRVSTAKKVWKTFVGFGQQNKPKSGLPPKVLAATKKYAKKE